jgi:membrane protein YdbS with pleckstrin-like domain
MLDVISVKCYNISMSKIDRIKEEVGWLKIAFGLAVALDASLVAWLAQNYMIARPIVIIATVVAAIVIAIAVVFINRRAFRRIEELEDL